MTSKNDVTGDELKTRAASDNYRSGWDRIFGKKDQDLAQTSRPEDKEQNQEQN
jgi:hypothetical protein